MTMRSGMRKFVIDAKAVGPIRRAALFFYPLCYFDSFDSLNFFNTFDF
jgi:hypothetical protein